MGFLRDLFGESKSEKVGRLTRQVTEFLDEFFDENPDVEVGEDDGEILIRKGSAILQMAFVEDDEDSDDSNLQMVIYAPLVKMPEEELLPFYRAVLELNHDLSIHGRLAIDEDVVVLMASVHADLLEEDIGAALLVTAVMHEADFLDDHLIDEYGARPISE